jgi:hypothetical protein
LIGNLFLAFPANWSRGDWYLDTLYYYTAAERVRTGQTLYWPWPEYGPHVLTEAASYPYERHPYPPFMAPALAPVTRVPYETFARFAYIPLFATFWIYAACLCKLATGRWLIGGTIVAGTLLGIVPGSYMALSLGQLDPILWAVFGLALASSRFRAVGFAVLTMVKLYGAWPLVLSWWYEGRRAVIPAAATVALGVGVGAIVKGPVGYITAFADWIRYMGPVVGQGTFNPHNVSLSFAGLRVLIELGWDFYVPGPLPQWARLYLTIVGVAAPLSTVWLMRRRDPVLQYAVITCVAVLFAPLCWVHYLPLLLAPAAILFRDLVFVNLSGSVPTETAVLEAQADARTMLGEPDGGR